MPLTCSDKPLLYDGYCGGGGAAKGYMEAGFRVVGIDVKPQPHYCGDGFIQMDFFEFYARVQAGEYPEPAAWHCSPPCQGYSIMHNLPWLKGREYPLLILPTLELLKATGKPYVLENVMGARYGAKGLSRRGIEDHGLKAGWLCGGMFGLPFYRHRLFATNWFWLAPGHPKHWGTILKGRNLGDREHGAQAGRRGGPLPKSKGQSGVAGITGVTGWRLAAEAMGIDWMNRTELTQAIPPAYTRFVGSGLMAEVKRRGIHATDWGAKSISHWSATFQLSNRGACRAGP